MKISDEVLARRDKDSFDAGFTAGIGWAIDTDNEPLIAAAPELLEALKQIVDKGAWQEHIEQARAAIAKATGGQP